MNVRNQRNNQHLRERSGAASRVTFWIIAVTILLYCGIAYQENVLARRAFDSVAIDTPYSMIKLDLLLSQSIVREDPDPVEEAKRRSEHGPHTQYVYVLRGKAAASKVRIGVGYEGRIIWKTATGLPSQ